MNRRPEIAALQGLARLLLDHRLALVRDTAARREQSLTQLAALERIAEPEDLPPLAAIQAALRYDLWADARRAELNTVLARQTADLMAAREDARLAFGRAEALRGVSARMAVRK